MLLSHPRLFRIRTQECFIQSLRLCSPSLLFYTTSLRFEKRNLNDDVFNLHFFASFELCSWGKSTFPAHLSTRDTSACLSFYCSRISTFYSRSRSNHVRRWNQGRSKQKISLVKDFQDSNLVLFIFPNFSLTISSITKRPFSSFFFHAKSSHEIQQKEKLFKLLFLWRKIDTR